MQGGGTPSNIYQSLGERERGVGGGGAGEVSTTDVEGELAYLGAFKLISAHLNSFRLI